MKNKLQILVTLLFLGLIGWWISFQSVVTDQGTSVQWFGSTYGVMALIGAIVGLIAARRWGGFKTVLGKSLTFFSIGLFAQEAGQLILAYYIYGSKIQIPYPSWGDVAYFTSTLSYLLGALYAAKAVGVKYSLKSNKYKFIAFAVPLALFVASFVVFLYHHEYDWHRPLTVFLDFGYPISDATYISLGIIAYILSRKMLGGIMRVGILVLIAALTLQYLADFTFLYQSSRGTYLAGEFADLFYLCAYFVTTSAMIQFIGAHQHLRSNMTTAKAAPAVLDSNLETPDAPQPPTETPAATNSGSGA